MRDKLRERRDRRGVGVTTLVVLACTATSYTAWSAAPPVNELDAAKRRPAKVAVPLEEQERTVAQFVSEHHAELNQLLDTLKTHNSAEYQRAVRDLHRAQQRLAALRERDPERYELEIKIWETKSRAQFVAAQLAIAKGGSSASGSDGSADALTQQLQKQLEKLVARNVNLRAQLLRRDRRRQQDRLRKLNEQLDELLADGAVRREVDALLQGVRRGGTGPSGTAPNKKSAKSTTGSAESP